MDEEMLTVLRELALRSKKSSWWQPWQFHEQVGADDAEFIAALSPEIVIELLQEIERRHGIQSELLECRDSRHALQLALETEREAANRYAKQVAHWIGKHDALLVQQLAVQQKQEPCAWTWDTAGSGAMGGFYSAHFQIQKPERTATMLNFTPLYDRPANDAFQWILVSDRLPNDDCQALVYTPAMNGEDERYDFEHYLEEEGGWAFHASNYEHFCMVAKGGSGVAWTGPSEKAKYTHWMPLPKAPAAIQGEKQ